MFYKFGFMNQFYFFTVLHNFYVKHNLCNSKTMTYSLYYWKAVVSLEIQMREILLKVLSN